MQSAGGGDITSEGNRASVLREGLIEWYVNDSRGLEQGFTMFSRPQPPQDRSATLRIAEPSQELPAAWADPLRIHLDITGILSPALDPNGDAINFIAPNGTTAIRLSALHTRDTRGQELPSRFELIGTCLCIVVQDVGASYPITIDPMATTPDWVVLGTESSSGFGDSVSSAGDVNGDGYDDVLVGAHYYPNGGQVLMFYGTAEGLTATPDWTIEGEPGAFLGYPVAAAGDVNGDGYDDVILGAGGFTDDLLNQGLAVAYYGSSTGLSSIADWTAKGEQAQSWFGSGVSSAGDVNGDGFDDVIVGAYSYDGGETSEGKAYVFLGSADGLSDSPVWTAESNSVNSHYGRPVGSAGDVNGDGFDDIIVGAPDLDDGEGDEGAAYLYLGSASGPLPSPEWMAEGNQSQAYFGRSVGSAGDVNGDGYDDVIVGANGYEIENPSEGIASVFLGSQNGLSLDPVWTGKGGQDYAYYGISVAGAGDVNGDGFGDIMVGAIWLDHDLYDEGAAFIYEGSADGIVDSPIWMGESDEFEANYGYVNTAGDVNGDGFDDVIVGAPYYDGDVFFGGAAFVYHGAPDAPLVCEGDANGDGAVDPVDVGFVLSRFACTYPDDGVNCLKADANGDGDVDPLDLGYVMGRFGECD